MTHCNIGMGPLNPLTLAAKDDHQESNESEEKDIAAALAKLSAADRAVAVAQKFCVVLEENRLGFMGTPVKVMIDGQPVFLCCVGCKKKALADPQATLAKAANARRRRRSDDRGSHQMAGTRT